MANIGMPAGTPTNAAHRQTILAQIISEIQGVVSSIDDRHQNIGVSLGRLLDPRPAPPPAGGIEKVAERPATVEGELNSILRRLRSTLETAEELANRFSSAV